MRVVAFLLSLSLIPLTACSTFSLRAAPGAAQGESTAHAELSAPDSLGRVEFSKDASADTSEMSGDTSEDLSIDSGNSENPSDDAEDIEGVEDLALLEEEGAECADEDEEGACPEEGCEDEGLEDLGDELAENGEDEVDPERRYTADISDEELQRLWVEDLEALGSISMGFAHAGRIINGVPFPESELWTIVAPYAAWTLSEVVDYLRTAIESVEREHPGSPKLRINHISAREGGPLRPHASHQNGRDVDLAFYYKTDVRPGFRGRREHLIDPARNWTLVRSMATDTDVQVILVDNRIQRVLYNHALSIGEDQEWLDSLFGFRGGTLLRHFRSHYDHFHVRFFAPRAQELGRRVQPLLAQRPEENRTVYRVRSGDTLGHIARRYDTTVRAIQRANNMRSSFLSIGRRLVIPLRKPCTICPLPPVVEIPPRRVRPEPQDLEVPVEMEASASASVSAAGVSGEVASGVATPAGAQGDES